MLAERIDVVIGVDTHKHTHTAAAVSPTGAVLDRLTVSADRSGYRQLAAFGARHGNRRLWAIEGTGTYGAGLTSLLMSLEEQVVEVDRPARPARRSGAKSDEIDAVRAAREVLARDHLGVPRGRDEREAIRVLLTTRAGAIEARTAALSALHALVTTAPEDLRQRLRRLPTRALVRTCAALRTSRRQSSEQFATVLAMRSTARRILTCEREAAELEQQLEALVRQVAPVLLQEVGVGPVVAGQLLASWSHRGRVRSEAAFAKLAGVAPLPASSGLTVRHRLSRMGDRQLNRALHTIVLVRLRQDPATKTYATRRFAEGKSVREVKRCLKRYVARQLFRQLEGLDRT
jgi:transposase